MIPNKYFKVAEFKLYMYSVARFTQFYTKIQQKIKNKLERDHSLNILESILFEKWS